MIDRKKINWGKIIELPTTNDMLDKLYGKKGSLQRNFFVEEAYAYYGGQSTERERKRVMASALELIPMEY